MLRTGTKRRSGQSSPLTWEARHSGHPWEVVNSDRRTMKTLFQDGGSVVKHLSYWLEDLSLDA